MVGPRRRLGLGRIFNLRARKQQMNYASDIRKFVVKTFLYGDADSLEDETSFMGGGSIDSTGILELISFLEKTYNVKVLPEEMIPANLDSVNKVARYLAGKQPRDGAA
jgi:acyl carrier protein